MKKDIIGPQIRDIELGKMARAIDQTTYYTEPSSDIVSDILNHSLFTSYLQHIHGLLGTKGDKLTEGMTRLSALEHIIRAQIELTTRTELHSEDFNAAIKYLREIKTD